MSLGMKKIVGIILICLSGIMMYAYITNFLESGENGYEISTCSKIFTLKNQKNLLELVKKTCKTNTENVKKDNFLPIISRNIYNCYLKTAKGYEIVNEIKQDEVCIICSQIKATESIKKEDIDFKSEVMKSMKDKNTKLEIVNNLPAEIIKDDILYIVYKQQQINSKEVKTKFVLTKEVKCDNLIQLVLN